MNLHEYQSKQLFTDFNLPVPKGVAVATIAEVGGAMASLSGEIFAVKAQIHAGGRGKAGGVKLLKSVDEIEQFVGEKIGKNLITHQTDKKGQPINAILIEETCDIDRELYLGIAIDRSSKRLMVMASTEGGMDIEIVSEKTPDKILKTTINPVVGLMPYQIRMMAFGLKLSAKQSKQFGGILNNLVQLFIQKDLSLLEINPLVSTKNDELICLDAKINVDSNALYRQKELLEIRDTAQEDSRELEAQAWDLNYISLDGSVGCMVNGAGLAMATMDLVQLHGGTPANFLDVGGTATAERVAKALQIIVLDGNVKSVLVNIFGGIVRCDLIAEGLIEAINKTKISVPLVVRLAGNNAKLGLEKLKSSGLNISVADDLTEAVKQAIKTAGGVK